MLSAKMAFRNISRQTKRSVLLGGAIAFGVMVTVLAGSLSVGILDNARRNMTDIFGGHVYVRGEEISPGGKTIAKLGDIGVLRESLGPISSRISSVHVRSSARCELVFGGKSDTVSASGVDWSDEASLVGRIGAKGTSGNLTEPPADNAILLPESVAAALGVAAGETVVARLVTVTGQVNVGDFIVAAVYPDRKTVFAAPAYVSIAALNSLIGIGADECQSLNITVKDISSIDSVAAAISDSLSLRGKPVANASSSTGLSGLASMRNALLGGAEPTVPESAWEGTRFTITTLNDLMDPLQSIMAILGIVRIGLFAILLVIILVGLLNGFQMILIERTGEIGTIRALGMQKGAVRNLFMLEALFLSLLGAGAGLVGSVFLSVVAGIPSFDGAQSLRLFTDGGHFSFPFVIPDVLLTLFVVVAATLFAAWGPARKAARLSPAEALRAAY